MPQPPSVDVAGRLRDLADYAERAESPIEYRTLRVELEALSKSLYRHSEDPPPPSVEGASVLVQRRIEWPDTDASGHYHYHTALRLIDAAEAVLHERIGIADDSFGRIPRVSLRVQYRRVLRFHDLVDVHLRVASVGRRAITYEATVSLDGELAVEGEVVAVHVDDGGRSATLPDAWSEALRTAGVQRAELLVSD